MMSLRDLVSGVVAVTNDDGFPLESIPQKGIVTVQLGSGKFVELQSNVEEFEDAQKHCRTRRTCMQCATGYTETLVPWPMQPYCPVCASENQR